ncbi:GntR family transcriptional regulator [Puniceicoccus vermicola]|uniref:GntR family transcriptional regulator n=1 Tax=Puniceicoccus vermicola TaxID=388746 RepID=A0A7X1B0A1_9BACT|nr:GntR family transcriptional regulator [Puniceicoccus vermicola]MBC2603251.1 GntR family transcriptional regulator [Puniceicoccus vermicola]
MARNTGIPHFLRIADKLAARFVSEEAGRRLPSVQAIARSEKVSINTAHSAVKELQRRGVAVSRRGSGSYSLGQEGPVAQVFGYFVHMPRFAAFFRSLTERLARQGLRVVLTETGLRGEALEEGFDPEEVAKAAIVVWVCTSHPEGVRACTRARRRLPARMPMILVTDPLGLEVTGGHRFDFVHWGTWDSTRMLVQQLGESGVRHPVWIDRSDVATLTQKEAVAGFLSGLVQADVRRPLDHIFRWDVERPGSLAALFAKTRSWQPGAILLQYDYQEEFRVVCSREGIRLPSDLPVLAFGHGESRHRLLQSWRNLARTCADLIASRLRDPARPNLNVSLKPLREKRKK